VFARFICLRILRILTISFKKKLYSQRTKERKRGRKEANQKEKRGMKEQMKGRKKEDTRDTSHPHVWE